MKTLFIHATVNADIALPEEKLADLPKRLGLFTTIQFLKKLPTVKRQLEMIGKEVKIIGQTLGCRADGAENADVDAFLYIGDGEFHPLLVAYKSNKPVFCYHPIEKTFSQIDEADVKKYHTQRKVGLMKFLHADNVGILVSTKSGQSDNKINSPGAAIKWRGVHELMNRNDGKNYYVFAFDTLELYRLEDFPFIDVWVNTACSRIVDGKGKLVNLDDIRDLMETDNTIQLRNE